MLLGLASGPFHLDSSHKILYACFISLISSVNPTQQIFWAVNLKRRLNQTYAAPAKQSSNAGTEMVKLYAPRQVEPKNVKQACISVQLT
jgi:hypothetical protein